MRITIWRDRACLEVPYDDPKGMFFYPPIIQMIKQRILLLAFNSSFLFQNKLPEVSKFAKASL